MSDPGNYADYHYGDRDEPSAKLEIMEEAAAERPSDDEGSHALLRDALIRAIAATEKLSACTEIESHPMSELATIMGALERSSKEGSHAPESILASKPPATPGFDALLAEDAKALRACLAKDASPHDVLGGFTLTQIAARIGHAPCLATLHEFGADFLSDSPGGASSLDIALSHGNQEAADFIQSAIDSFASKSTKPSALTTRVAMIEESGSMSEFEEIFGDIFEAIQGKKEPEAPKKTIYVGEVEISDFSDLGKLAAKLTLGANPDPVDVHGMTPSMHAIRRPADGADILETLLRGGANPDAATAYGTTLCMMAGRDGSIECAKVLLKHGADASLKDKGGCDAARIARIRGTSNTAAIEKLMALASKKIKAAAKAKAESMTLLMKELNAAAEFVRADAAPKAKRPKNT